MNQDFVDLLRALCAREARFLVVGAYAMAIHGRPRATGDLDLWVEPTVDNAARVYAALQEFGAPLDELTSADLTTEGLVFQMGRPPFRIDIITRASGLSFADAWRRKASGRFGDLDVGVLGLDDQIINKRATGRDKDLLDARELEAIRAQSGT